MGSRIRAKRRFGMAGGKHSKCRKTTNETKHYKCINTNSMRLNFSRKIVKASKKKKQFSVKARNTYMLKHMGENLKFVIKKIQPININGYRMISLDCLQENLNVILKHCIVCVLARDAVLI